MKERSELFPSVLRWAAYCVSDTLIVVFCAFLAMLARYAPSVADEVIDETVSGLIRLIVSYVGCNILLGVYRIRWRFLTPFKLVRQAAAAFSGFGVSFLWEELLDMPVSRRYYLLIVFMFVLSGLCCFRLAVKLMHDRAWKDSDEVRRIMSVREAASAGHVIVNIGGVHSECAASQIASSAVTGEISDVILHLPFHDEKLLNEITESCLRAGCFVKHV